MLRKSKAFQWAIENAVKNKDRIPKKYYNLEEWIKLTFPTEEAQGRMWRYCDGFKLIDSPWVPSKKGFEMGIYEISYVFEGIDDEGQEKFSEAGFVTPFGQVFLKDLFRLCLKYNVAPYYNN